MWEDPRAGGDDTRGYGGEAWTQGRPPRGRGRRSPFSSATLYRYATVGLHQLVANLEGDVAEGRTRGRVGDQPGTLLRDFHTVADLRGMGLPTATVDAKGRQKRRSTSASQLTQRYYLQDAVFVVAVHAPAVMLETLVHALRNPGFPLALGRRACPPAHPLLLADGTSFHWAGDPLAVLARVAWQAGRATRLALERRRDRPPVIELPVTVDDREGDDVRADVPTTFAPRDRGFTTRRVRQTWVRLPPPYEVADALGTPPPHDPFALLGW